MRREQELGREIHMTSNFLDRRMNAVIFENGAEGVTPMHGMMLRFIGKKTEVGHDVYQKDIEAEFDIARSTVTATLKLMEKKGYIIREGVEHDARLKRLLITPLGEDAFERVRSSIQKVEALMREAFTKEEYAQLIVLLTRVQSVL